MLGPDEASSTETVEQIHAELGAGKRPADRRRWRPTMVRLTTAVRYTPAPRAKYTSVDRLENTVDANVRENLRR